MGISQKFNLYNRNYRYLCPKMWKQLCVSMHKWMRRARATGLGDFDRASEPNSSISNPLKLRFHASQSPNDAWSNGQYLILSSQLLHRSIQIDAVQWSHVCAASLLLPHAIYVSVPFSSHTVAVNFVTLIHCNYVVGLFFHSLISKTGNCIERSGQYPGLSLIKTSTQWDGGKSSTITALHV